ncbi:MAG: hypothetical protein KIS73_18040 [Enhydrobacter sp.]|nr:hypothetical protein [Enhydrobacter sp.]
MLAILMLSASRLALSKATCATPASSFRGSASMLVEITQLTRAPALKQGLPA